MNEDLKRNLTKLPRNYSTWALTIVMLVAGWWLQLPPTDQQTLIAAFPWLKYAAPLAGLITVLGARIIPQASSDKPPEQ